MMHSLSRKIVLLFGLLAYFFTDTVLALNSGTSGIGLGAVSANVTSNFGGVAKMMTAGSYVAGMGFAIGAVLKFKAHKDAPTQITVGTPIALVFIAATLIFLPSIFKASGQTMFGSSGGYIAGISGITTFGAEIAQAT